jgi:hypothetical protein
MIIKIFNLFLKKKKLKNKIRGSICMSIDETRSYVPNGELLDFLNPNLMSTFNTNGSGKSVINSENENIVKKKKFLYLNLKSIVLTIPLQINSRDSIDLDIHNVNSIYNNIDIKHDSKNNSDGVTKCNVYIIATIGNTNKKILPKRVVVVC